MDALLKVRAVLALIILVAVVSLAGFVLWKAVELDKLQLAIGVMLLTGLRDQLKEAFAWFFDGIAHTGPTTSVSVTTPPDESDKKPAP